MSASLPSTQSQWQLSKFGGGIEALKFVKDAQVPQPKRGQVLVRVRATSLNYRDLLLAKGLYPTAMADNTVPVSDGAGDVAAIGEDVTEFKVGDRVAAIFTPKWQDGDNRRGIAYSGSLGGNLSGTLSQYILLDATALVALPAGISYEEGAALPCAGVTAWNALVGARFPVRSDHTVLVMGTGGVSLIAAQIAHAHGARVIATSSSDDKLAKLVSLGLVKKGDTINYKTTPDWGKEAKRISGRGVDHVIEIGGQGTIKQSIEAVGPDGEVAVIGLVAGFHAENAVDPMKVLAGGFSLRGLLVGHRRHFQDLLTLYEHNPALKLSTIIDEKIFSFSQAQEAYKHLESGSHFGKVVIRVD